MIYRVPFDDVPTAAVADQYATLAAVIVGNLTTSGRCRIRAISVGGSDDTPVDKPVRLQIKRIADAAGGTTGTAGTSFTTAQVPKVDPGAIDSLMTAKAGYTAEPTVYDSNPVWQGAFNARGSIYVPFDLPERVVGTKNMHIGLLAAPSTAAAIKLSGHLEFEMF